MLQKLCQNYLFIFLLEWEQLFMHLLVRSFSYKHLEAIGDSKALIWQSHGLLCTGKDLDEAWIIWKL
jgi:ribulose-5-phosphate 4-epimerase/fuculose-1-phosphate aldolase